MLGTQTALLKTRQIGGNKTTALYCRLSREDEHTTGRKSNSKFVIRRGVEPRFSMKKVRNPPTMSTLSP